MEILVNFLWIHKNQTWTDKILIERKKGRGERKKTKKQTDKRNRYLEIKGKIILNLYTEIHYTVQKNMSFIKAFLLTNEIKDKPMRNHS